MKLVNKTVVLYPMFDIDDLIDIRTEAQVWSYTTAPFEYQAGDQFIPIIEEHFYEAG